MSGIRFVARLVLVICGLTMLSAIPSCNQNNYDRTCSLAAAAYTGANQRLIREDYERESDRIVSMFWHAAEIAAAMLIVLAIVEQKRPAVPQPEPLEQRYVAAPMPLSITEPPLSAPPPPKPVIPVAIPPGVRPPLPPQSFEAMLESTVGRLR